MTIPDNEAKLRPITFRIFMKIVIGVGLTAFVLWVWQSSIVRLSKNFYEVDPGKFYRSAQLTPAELAEVVEKYHIKTVVSLRGAPENSYWVPGQKKVLENHNVKFYSFGWTTDYFPKTEELKGYLQILKNAEFPVLVHCRTGADRTGEATAMYAIDFMHMPKQEAIDRYLNFKYWHVQMFHPAKAEFVRQYPGLDQALASYELCSPQYRKYAEPGRCPEDSSGATQSSSN